jgi:glycosyltransferase involved in cell wall biosynthesis
MKPLVSIIIPTLNEEKYIGRVLESIKAQNFPCEIIIGDGGSTDKTLEIAKRYGAIIIRKDKNTRKAKNDGARARNDGAKIAKAEMLLSLDADVILDTGFLKSCYDEIKKKKLDVATCYSLPDTEDLRHIINYEIANSWIFLLKKIKPYAQLCIFCSKKVDDLIGGYDEDITFGDDSNYVCRASKVGKFGILDKYIRTSARRFAKEGNIKSTLKYAYLNLYRLLIGEIKKDINYKSDYSIKKA